MDLDQDGYVDIVAGTYAGSPYVAHGCRDGWNQPVPILDKAGQRIVANLFWDRDARAFDDTKRCDPEGLGLLTSKITAAFAADMDADGDLDLLLGDQENGYVLLRRNEGSAKKLAFATRNEVIHAGGSILMFPGKLTTLRLVDWNGDGRSDLLLGSVGERYARGFGGEVCLFENHGTNAEPRFGPPRTLIGVRETEQSDPARPDWGLCMDVGDPDGDGDLDLLVGGYAHWTPPARKPSLEEGKRLEAIRQRFAALDVEKRKLQERLSTELAGLGADEAERKRVELQRAEERRWRALVDLRRELAEEVARLQQSPQRVSYVWLYENQGVR